ncbi:HAT family dimerization domain-containing protein [Mycena venus]|uniref:HAT family dimerization domain-containing protein n=1 Tax=Mycena venus TaxID=2733690 RepID=A0A8H6TW64_9AGAR|nr:HAT family dimerization domain-containing protein [Mycena venus]
MTFLEIEFDKRKIRFRKSERCIRCFPHIVNLACKAVLGAITDMDFAASGSADFIPDPTRATTFLDAIARDPVATIRTTVRVIRASSLRRQYFSEVLKALQQKDLQLLRDVDTRWSSTLIMIDRAILLHEAIDKFLTNDQFRDLHKYKLGDDEWDALEAFKRILSVPHAFQQRLASPGGQGPILTRASSLPNQPHQHPRSAFTSLKDEVQSYFLEPFYTLGSVRYWDESQL